MKKSTLRQQAEEKLSQKKSAATPLTDADTMRLLHELQVHQIELKMQNEELMQLRAETEAALRQYTDLYDFAPMAYFTLARDGAVRKVNMAGANLLGLRCGDLLNRRLGIFALDDSHPAFNAFFDELLTGAGKKTCELIFEKKEEKPLWVRLEATCFEGGQECRVAMVDITERKQAEMELIQSEAKFRSTFDQSPVGSVIVGLDKHFIRCNSAFCNFLGYPESELIGKTISDVTHPEDLEIGMKELKQMVEGKIESYTGQKRYLRKDGAIVWTEISIRLVRDTNNKPLCFIPIIQNITERKRAEDALKESEKRFATIFRANPAAIAMTWLDDGHLVDVNAAWQRMTGYVHTEVVGRTAQELNLWVKPEQRERLMEMLGEQGKAHGEMELRCKSGEPRDLLMSADLIELDGKSYLLTMAQDVTESKRAEMELIQSEVKFRSTFDQSPVGSVIVGLDKHFIRCNSAFCNFLGYPESELIGKTISDVTHPEDLEIGMKELKQMVEGKIESYTGQKRYLRKDGAIVWAEISIRLVRDTNNKPLYFIPIIQNITERKQVEDELRESEEKYRQIVDTAGEGIWMINAEGNTTFANQKMTEMLGYSAGEMLGVSFFTFMDEDGKALAAANVERRRQGIKEQHDFKFRRKDGSDLWAILETNPIVDKDERYAGALAMITDITERKQVEEALRESEERLRLANKATNDVIWDWDIVNDSQRWNEAGTVVFGWSDIVESPQPATWWLKRIHPEDRQRVENGFFGVTADPARNYWHDEYRFRKMDGSYAQVIDRGYVLRNGQGKAVRMIGAMLDITERRQAEEKLRESEKEFHSLAEAMPQIVWITRPDGWNIYFNQQWVDYTGQTLEESYGHGWNKPFHPDDQQRAWDAWQNATKNSADYSLECRLRRVDGVYTWWLIRGVPLMDAHGNILKWFGTCTDIHEIKQAEEALGESEKRFRTLVEQAPTAIFIQTHGQFAYINKAGLTLFGAESEDQLLGQPVLDRFHSKVREQVLERIRQLNEQGKEVPNAEEIIIKLDGSCAETEVSAVPFYFKGEHGALVFVRDITERKQAENRLRQRSDELNALNVLGREVTASFSSGSATAVALNGIMNAIQPDLAYLFLCDGEKLIPKESQARNTEDGTVELPAHRVGECMCGLSARENKAFFSRDIFVDWRCTWDECKKAGVKSFAALPLRSGNEVFGVIGLASFAERDFEQQAEFLETLSSQISAALENARLFETVKSYASELERRVEARTSELREAQEKLVRNEKLAVLGQLAGGVGHELRNPLAVINNALYYLKLIGANGNEKVKEYLGIIQTEAHTAEKIITDLLDFARIKSVDVETVSASRLVERVLERYPAPKDVSVRLEIPEDLPKLHVDPRQMEQVLGNLVINACQAMMPSGGELTVTTHRQQEMVAIAVRDTGVGISPENMKKLFEPLFTTKAKGIGLGLAVSQKLAEANGGRIEVQSEAGVGSTFTVYLPVQGSEP